MNYKIAICDDEKEQSDYLAQTVSEWAGEQHSVSIKLFPSAEAFLFEYENNNIFDILLLDVEMNTITGIDLAKQIRKKDKHAEIVFVTSHVEFMGEGYEVDALHYLLKPVKKEKLLWVLDKAAERLLIEPPSVLIHCGGETVKLMETDILYVESFLHYIVIHTVNGEYKIKESISTFEKKLSKAFFRIHRSYIASLVHIIRISRTEVTIEGNITLPLSRGLYDDVNRAFIESN